VRGGGSSFCELKTGVAPYKNITQTVRFGTDYSYSENNYYIIKSDIPSFPRVFVIYFSSNSSIFCCFAYGQPDDSKKIWLVYGGGGKKKFCTYSPYDTECGSNPSAFLDEDGTIYIKPNTNKIDLSGEIGIALFK
jgi:hypothetical protein